MTDTPRFGSYAIVSELGSGTLATVYKAIQEPLGRKVAIKALRPTISPNSSFAAPLEREARILAEVLHPNVAVLLDFVKTSDQMYLVLEYISGYSLAQVLARKVKLRPEVAAGIGVQVARGLAHVHERGVVHRDIKPANIIIDKRGNVKLVDFGIAQRDRLPTADEPLLPESRESLFGTSAYMAPEQLLGDAAGPASDLFSLGVVLYQCLAGTRPFDRDERGQGDAERRAPGLRTRRDPPVPLVKRVPDVPRSLDRIIMRCLEKNADDRPVSARLVAKELVEMIHARTDRSEENLACSALASARLPSDGSGKPTALAPLADPGFSPSRSPWTLLGATLVLALGFGAIRASAHEQSPIGVGREGILDPSLSLVGQVRILATPWAAVAVDGQTVDTTPMATPVRLSPGAHYFTFSHPAAPPETRRVVVAPGQTLVLDVAMAISALDAGSEGGPDAR